MMESTNTCEQLLHMWCPDGQVMPVKSCKDIGPTHDTHCTLFAFFLLSKASFNSDVDIIFDERLGYKFTVLCAA